MGSLIQVCTLLVEVSITARRGAVWSSGKSPAIVHGKGNPLRLARDGNDGQGFLRDQVNGGDRSRSNVGGVAPLPVMGDGEHVRFALASGDEETILKLFGSITVMELPSSVVT